MGTQPELFVLEGLIIVSVLYCPVDTRQGCKKRRSLKGTSTCDKDTIFEL